MHRAFILFLIIFGCKNSSQKQVKKEFKPTTIVSKDTFKINENYIAKSFDFPVGKPNGKGYYNAQKFQENYHLGDDWNSVKGGNSDLGDPIYAIANGYVSQTKNYKGGWGNVIRIVHYLSNKKTVESLYAHCDTILVKNKVWVKKGEKIGTIGNVNGLYYAHLHLEIRDKVDLPLGAGYSKEFDGYLDPTKFIKEHRTLKN
ncbi:M23 family metallopeptidase [Polaribacter porphyrae]|uniref:Peptidase M23 n=1 Tax=Polaribacter porphyrae TaxID=1137780 RepID=A0A2S7WRE4_9FLAO|nr:M23 family metallopeptidase [Polaribacter porphyrae]PQJ80177.1 peptidase M23 [Polaribacter porphyrae]